MNKELAIECIKTQRQFVDDMTREAFDMAIDLIKENVAPVKHGHWQITDAYPHNVYCSECHTKYAQKHWAIWEDGSMPRRYCPNCGAKMDIRTMNRRGK